MGCFFHVRGHLLVWAGTFIDRLVVFHFFQAWAVSMLTQAADGKINTLHKSY